jgi:hypothetical protein
VSQIPKILDLPGSRSKALERGNAAIITPSLRLTLQRSEWLGVLCG